MLEAGMHRGWKIRQSAPLVFRGFAAGGAILLLLAPAVGAGRAPVTLRCTLSQPGSADTMVQYFIVDSDQKTVSAAGETYRVGADPNGKSGKVITRWSDTEITLVNEEWIREGWQRFRFVTVLDRLTGAIRSENIDTSYSGNCAVADVTKKLF
jgi:hypothetical protein